MNPEILKDAVNKIPDIKGLRLALKQARDGREWGLLVEFKGESRTYRVQRRYDLTPTSVTVLASPTGKADCLVSAPYISNACGEMLLQHDIPFLDDQGHIYLRTDNLCIFILGRTKRASVTYFGTTEAPSRMRAFTNATLKMIYGFLTDPSLDTDLDASLLNQAYREVARVAGVSLGSVKNVMDDLIASHFVEEELPERRRLVNRRKLFERWVPDYATRLRPKLVMARFRPPHVRWWENADLGDWGLWGGEVAGAKLTEFLVPETSTIYAASVPDSFIVQHDLRKDPAGTVEILKPMNRLSPEMNWNGCVHPLLAYADLAATDIDRNLQTAQRMYDRYLRQLIESD